MEKFGKKDFINAVKKIKPLFSAGSRTEYSNVGYTLLAYIIEEITKNSYEAYLKANLFDPFGIRLGYVLQPWLNKRNGIAVGYYNGKRWGTFYEKYGNNNGNPSWNLVGNGALHGSLMDMYRWDRALRGTVLLSEEAKKKYYTQHMQENDSDEFMGYGNMVNRIRMSKDSPEEFISEMGGSNGVFSAVLKRWLSRDRMIYIVGSDNENMVFDIWRKVVRILDGTQ